MRFYDRLTHAVLRRPVELALAAPIGVMQQAVERTPPDQRHVEGVQRQLPGDALAQRPAHDDARAEIEDHGQVQPALAGGM